MNVRPENMRHACEHCHVAEEGDTKLMICGACKTARYCNAECQHADWDRHKLEICKDFGHQRGSNKPLHSACRLGDLTEVRRLVEVEGADIDRTYTGGPTPLSLAALSGQIDVVRYLVEHDADMTHASSWDFTPLRCAATNGHLQVVDYLVRQGADVDISDALLFAACGGSVNVVRYLVDHGADVMSTLAPLRAATSKGHYAVVRYLVQKGADINATNSDGKTLLQIARDAGHTQVVAYLLAEGAIDG